MPSVLALVRLLLALGVFLLPGWGLVTWLHRGEGASRALRTALAFAWSFAVFSAVGWPFLWWRGSFAAFAQTLGPVWALFAVFGLLAWCRARPAPPESLPEMTPREENEAPPPSASKAWAPWLLLGYLALAGQVTWLWGQGEEMHEAFAYRAPLVLLGGVLLAGWLWRTSLPPPSRPSDERPAPRSWRYAALAFVLLQAASAAVMSRPDWDDCYYLAAVDDNRQAAAFNAEEPSHHEGLAVPVQHRTLCWELWMTVLCALTGLHPMVLAHTLLVPLLVLLCYAAYAGLLGELLPRRWVPLGLIALAAMHLWWISSHDVASNFLLPRPWQSKSLLGHLAVPLVATLLLRLAAAPGLRGAISLAAAVSAGLGLSLSALFVLLPLLGGLGLVLLRHGPRRGAFFLGVGGATLPLLLAGLGMKLATHGVKALVARPPYVATWLLAVHHHLRHGSLELVWILALPVSALLLAVRAPWARQARAYLLGFSAVLGATFINPLLYHGVARELTTYHTYFRMWWLVPATVGMAVLLVLLVRWLAGRSEPAALAGVLALVLAMLGLPGLVVWDVSNSFIGVLGQPALAENWEKMPAGLKTLAERLRTVPDITETRLLCNEQVASFLVSYDRRFRFVQTRPLYTPLGFQQAGRPVEGLERHWLATSLEWGARAPEHPETWAQLRGFLGDDGVAELLGPSIPRMSRDVPMLLERYRVRYAITGPGDAGTAWLVQNGFVREASEGPFILWLWHRR